MDHRRGPRAVGDHQKVSQLGVLGPQLTFGYTFSLKRGLRSVQLDRYYSLGGFNLGADLLHLNDIL